MTYQILIIEDENVIRGMISDILIAEQFNVLEAVNGEQGIEIAIREQPHLIICDLVMPDLSGYQVLEKLRNTTQTSLTPFIFLTTQASPHAYRQGMELGADDYLIKPFSQEELVRAVQTRLKKQTFLLAQLNSCYQEVRSLKQKNQQLNDRKNLEQEVMTHLVEDLRGNFSKLNLAVKLLKKETNEQKRTRYIEILEEEITWEMQLLNKVSHLQTLIKSEDLNFLHRYLFENYSKSKIPQNMQIPQLDDSHG